MMKLPRISREIAEKAWNSMQHNKEYDSSEIALEYIGEDDLECFSDIELIDMIEDLERVMSRFKGVDMKREGGIIDSEIVEPVHRALSAHATPFQLSQIGFWMWLSNIARNGYLWRFIYWRFGGDQKVNWGITTPGSIKEVYFYRAWLRGHRMHDPSLDDPYHYAKLGSSDIWRSHILRQEFGNDKEFVKAFLDTIHTKSGKIKTKILREGLIPKIREWTSGASFSHLSYEENKELLSYLLEKARADDHDKIDKG